MFVNLVTPGVVLVCLIQQITPLQVWPKPQQYQSNGNILSISPSTFQFSGRIRDCDIIKAAVVRYRNLIFLNKRQEQGNRDKRSNKLREHSLITLRSLKINYNGECLKYPNATMNEMYELKVATPDIDVKTAILTAKSPWGVLRGLETFSQLVTVISDTEYEIQGVQISDFPRFGYRGFMIETSLHFISKSLILKSLDLMAHNKMNVFHWHIVDGPSFPFQSVVFPELSNKGAYSKNHVYTPSDVAEIIEFARMRGIRVIPEFDTPGHSRSWGKGIKNLLVPLYHRETGKLLYHYGINPLLNSTFTFLEKFFEEIVEVFKDQYIHLGGDELHFYRWKLNKDIKKFMDDKGYTTYPEVQNYYEQKLLQVMKTLSRDTQTIFWEELLENGAQLGPDSIVHVWKKNYPVRLAQSTKAGYRTLFSSGWYLNAYQPARDWPNYYTPDPHNFTGNYEQKQLIIGGEACVWVAYIDGSNLISHSWPRASLPAERLWSAKNVTDVKDAKTRLDKFRCLLIRRGYRVEPITGAGFCPDDYLVV